MRSHSSERLKSFESEQISGTNPAHESPVRAVRRKGNVGGIKYSVFGQGVSGSRSKIKVMGMKDFSCHVWRGSNDSRNATQAQAEQGTIEFGEFMEGLMRRNMVSKQMEVANNG